MKELKKLLELRKEEYEIFGATSEDREQDNIIKQQIKDLEAD